MLPDPVGRVASTRYPQALRNEVEDVVGEYLFDCTDFRTEDKVDLLRQIYEMTDKRFKLADHLLRTKPWDLFAMVEMGTDRIYHGFWKDMDPEHRKHLPGGPYEDAILDYHVHVDGLVANLLRHADDETAVLVVSDHGAKRMDGGIRINEWLRQEGLLATRSRARGPVEHARLRHRLVAHEGLGRGRLLLPRLPQRGGPRAERDDPRGRLRALPRRARAAHLRDPGRARQPDPDEGVPARGRVLPRSRASRPT